MNSPRRAVVASPGMGVILIRAPLLSVFVSQRIGHVTEGAEPG